MQEIKELIQRMMPTNTALMTTTGPMDEPTDELILLFNGRFYPPEVLKKYALEIDAMLKTEHFCPRCRGIEDCKLNPPGWQTFFNEDGTRFYEETFKKFEPHFSGKRCDFWYQEQAKEQEQKLLTARNQRMTFETFRVTDANREAYEKCLNYAKNFSRFTTNGLILVGPVGTGKTHLAMAIARRVVRIIPTAFISVPKLLNDIKNAFREETGEELHRIEQMMQKRFLVLDDIGVEKTTEWVLETFYMLIDYRYGEMLPTVITSNLSREELANKIGERVVDRLYAADWMEQVVFTGKSWRRRRGGA